MRSKNLNVQLLIIICFQNTFCSPPKSPSQLIFLFESNALVAHVQWITPATNYESMNVKMLKSCFSDFLETVCTLYNIKYIHCMKL